MPPAFARFVPRALMLITAVSAGALSALAALPANLTGTWLTADGTSKIRFEPCQAAICGRIVWIADPVDKGTGGPVLDKNNPNPALQKRSLVGITLLSDLKPGEASGEWDGHVYNPRDGNTYDIIITLKSADRLELKGCLIAGFLCMGEIWTKVADVSR
jgi:uncharacterized protein (DUF2147 family)